MNKNLSYNVVFRPEPEGGFTIIVPSLPGCVSYGNTLEEAKKWRLTPLKDILHLLESTKILSITS